IRTPHAVFISGERDSRTVRKPLTVPEFYRRTGQLPRLSRPQRMQPKLRVLGGTHGQHPLAIWRDLPAPALHQAIRGPVGQLAREEGKFSARGDASVGERDGFAVRREDWVIGPFKPGQIMLVRMVGS